MLENSQSKKYYKADEIANVLGVKKFVLRTWEKQFDLNRAESQYNEDDLKIFKTIRDLLYEQKLSPTAAKQKLPDLLLQQVKTEHEPVAQVIAEIEKSVRMDSTETVRPERSVAESNGYERVQLTPQEIVELKQEISKIEEPEEIVAATLSEETNSNQVQPAFKQNEEFWNNLRSFKEQLLKIQEQLK